MLSNRSLCLSCSVVISSFWSSTCLHAKTTNRAGRSGVNVPTSMNMVTFSSTRNENGPIHALSFLSSLSLTSEDVNNDMALKRLI